MHRMLVSFVLRTENVIYNVIVFFNCFLYYNHLEQIESLLLLNLSLLVCSDKEVVQTETSESLKC